MEGNDLDEISSSRLLYREWSPQVRLLSQIPTRIHRNIVGYDLNLTCIAAHKHFLALGTNAGLVYWYNRRTGDLRRLWCSDRTTPISKIGLVETVDFMLAAGNTSGQLTIFQIPRPLDPSLVRFATAGALSEGREAEFFTIPGAHKSRISALAWAVNGMKLFSGDQTGEVFMTEIDFITRTTSTIRISEEKDEIVQLSYIKNFLLISTLEKCLLCYTAENYRMSTVGSHPRKVTGHFGGVVFASKNSKDVCALVCRPKKTLYDLNPSDGKVRATILLKSLIAKSHRDIPLINPSVFQNDFVDDEAWRLQKLSDDSVLFCVYGSSVLHIVHPYKPDIIASCNGLRKVLDLSCANEEIFVLEGPRTVIRIATEIDQFESRVRTEPNVNPLGDEKPEGTGLETVTNMISVESFANKIPNSFSSISDKFGMFFRRSSEMGNEEPRVRCASPAEEAAEVQNVKSPVDPSLVEHRSPIATRNKVKIEKKATQKDARSTSPVPEPVKSSSPGTSTSSVVSNDDDFLYNDLHDGVGGTLQNLRLEFQGSPDDDDDDHKKEEHVSNQDVKFGTPEEKEARLLKALSLDKYMPASFLNSRFSKTKTDTASSNCDKAIVDTSTENRTTSDLLYGPPSDSSASTMAPVSIEATLQPMYMEVHGQTVENNWTRFESPSSVENGSLIVSDLIVFTNQRGEVYLSSTQDVKTDTKILKWEKASYLADKIVTSPSGDVIWRLNSMSGWAAKVATLRGGEENWSLVQHQVQDIALTSNSAWTVTMDGSFYIQTNISSIQPFALESRKVEADFVAKKIAACDRLVLAVSNEGILMGRLGISSASPDGTNWMKIDGTPLNIISVRVFENECDENFVKILLRTSEETIFVGYGTTDELFAVDDDFFQWHELDLYLPTGVSGFEASLGNGFLCLSSTKNPEIYIRSGTMTGMIWNNLNLKGISRFKEINASGLYKLQGLFWTILFPSKPGNNEIFYTAFHDSSLHKVSLPQNNSVACLAAAPQALWILTTKGKIFIRTNMDKVAEGSGWKELDLAQLTSTSVKLTHLSLSSDAVWAVDSKGAVWMRLGPLSPPTGDYVPVWIPVDGGVTPRGSETITSSVVFSKIYSSASGRIVWALDTEQNVYLREGIFPDFKQGVDWYLVSGMSAVALTVSDLTVWALASNGHIYKRVGVDENNYVGEAWKKVTNMKVTSFSATICDSLFGVDMEGQINQLITRDFQISDQSGSKGSDTDQTDDGEWTLVS